jgi:hypothetical protein
MIINDNPIEFKFPIKADADRIVDADGLEICSISPLCSPEEAIRWAKFLAGSYQAYAFLDGIKQILIAAGGHDPETHEKGAPCMICDIDEFFEEVINEPKKPSSIITE